MRYRSRHTVEAYYRDGTPEADSAIIQAVDGAELMTDSLGDTHLYVPAMFGKHKMKVGWWIYKYSATGGWEQRNDEMFRQSYEVPEREAGQ